MPHVVASSEVWPFTDGESEFEVTAVSVGGLISELDGRYPGLGEFIDRRMAVAIDGEIHQDAWFATLRPDSEVHLIPKIGGG